MRQIGSIQDSQQVEEFAAYLVTLGIACSVDTGASGYVIWVQNEDRVSEAKEELARFRSEPTNARYRSATQQAETVIRERAQQAEATRRRTINLRERWRKPTVAQGPATFGLMALMMIVGVLTGLEPAKHEEFYLRMVFSFDAIRAGEVWRLVSPIFLHFGIMHFLFNMIALRDLGLLVEYRVGTPRYFSIVMVIAILSNAAQFAMSGAGFGGMSGVVYGLFGFAWVRGRLDPDSGLALNPTAVTFMLGWYVLCLFVIPGIANWAHTGGLVVGAALGASGPMWKSLKGR